MKIGKTIVSEREKVVSESERMAQRKKTEKRKKLSIAIFFAIVALIIVVLAGLIINFANERKKNELPEPVTKVYTPTVEIYDESESGYITDKIKSTVGMLESDFQDYGYKVTKAIVPIGTTREVDIYLDGMETYFKVHTDRNTGESAEDAVRMINYLEGKDIKARYVDVRIAGRAYYIR
jgi:predicted nucleic acid-binding Zn ribbon protein